MIFGPAQNAEPKIFISQNRQTVILGTFWAKNHHIAKKNWVRSAGNKKLTIGDIRTEIRSQSPFEWQNIHSTEAFLTSLPHLQPFYTGFDKKKLKRTLTVNQGSGPLTLEEGQWLKNGPIPNLIDLNSVGISIRLRSGYILRI